MAKAILISEENMDAIKHSMGAYDNEELDGLIKELKGGRYHLVLDFGSGTNTYGYLNEEVFKRDWVSTGKKLDRGWVEVKRRLFQPTAP